MIEGQEVVTIITRESDRRHSLPEENQGDAQRNP
jgi:hypothetical protein